MAVGVKGESEGVDKNEGGGEGADGNEGGHE